MIQVSIGVKGDACDFIMAVEHLTMETGEYGYKKWVVCSFK